MQSTGQASTQGVSFTPMQGSAITYAIGRLPPQSYASRREDSSEAEVNCRHHGNHGGENFGADVSSLEHEGVCAVLSGCARYGAAIRRRNCRVLFPACEVSYLSWRVCEESDSTICETRHPRWP